MARQFATLDHLSDGRAGWNIVTSSDAFTGENFRRGGFLDHSDRYKRAEEFVTVAREFWDSWAPDAVLADRDSGVYVDPTRVRVVEHRGPQFDVRGVSTLPRAPQGHPVLLQAGDSADGRAFLAKYADAAFTLHSTLEAGQSYYADVKQQAASYGRDPNRLKVFPAATFVLGDTQAEAAEKARHIRRQQVGPQTAIAMLEQVWQRDLSGYDPDGPLPDVEPADDPTITQGRVRHGDPKAVAAAWRERAEAENLSIRELVIAVTSRQQFVGTPAQVADEIDLHVQADACDGFILVPHLTPHGLDDFVDRVVPLLQERGASGPNTPGIPCATTSAYRLARGVRRQRGWWAVSISQTTVGWLILAAAAMTFVVGFALRTFIGRRRDTKAVRRLVHAFRRTGVARVLFGRFEGDVLDDDELDSMILMPTIVIGCGLCLTAIFLLGYESLV